MESTGPRITIKDLARLAGVSIGTVDRVLHGRGRVSAETTTRIQNLVKETGYQPDLLASHLRTVRTITLGILMPHRDQDSGYWDLCYQGIQQGVKEFEAFGVQLRFFFFDRYGTVDFETLLGSPDEAHSAADGWIIAPVVAGPLERVWDRLEVHPGTKPVVFFDSDLPHRPALSRIGQDSLRAGKLGAKLLCLATQNQGPWGVIDLAEEDFHLGRRVEGFRQWFSQDQTQSEVKIYSYPDSDDQEEVRRRVREIASTESDLRGLFVPNATVHRYVEARDQENLSWRVVGFDDIRPNLEYLAQGKIDFLISQQPTTQGYLAVASLVRYLVLNQRPLEVQQIPLSILTKENL